MGSALKQLKQPFVTTRITKKKVSKEKKLALAKKSLFYFFMLTAIVLSAIALSRVVLYALYNQYAIENGQIKQNISEVEQTSQELLSQKLALESPQRIESLATNKLKMIRAENIRYIVYEEPEARNKLAYGK